MAMEVDAAALDALASDPQVVSIEEDKLLKPMLEESLPLIGAPEAWSQGFSGAGQTVAILDDGVDKDHPFLQGKVVSEACYSGGGAGESLCPGGVAESTRPGSGMPCSDPDASCSHGTHVAGIAAGFSGVAKDANLISIQIFSKFEPEDCSDDDEEEESDEPCIKSTGTDRISGLERVLELSDRFDIAAVNMSLGSGELFPGDCDSSNRAEKAAIDNLRALGIASIGASGNEEFSTGMGVPACISSVVSVGSTDDGSFETTRDEVSDFSNSSPELDLLAPGRWITSSHSDRYLGTNSGTSQAVPHVAGAWAVLKSKAPGAQVEQVLSALKSTGAPITDPRNGLTRPRIQVDAALNVFETPLRFSHRSGTSLTLTAKPNPGFVFKSWRGCDSVSGTRCTVRVSSARNVSAFFESVTGEPEAPEGPDLTRWVIPTMANAPGKGKAYYRTKVIVSNFDEDLELTARLYGPGGLAGQGAYSLKANHYRVWSNFLEEFFDYQGAGAVEFSGNAPFTVSAVVYTTSPHGTYTTVVHNGPAPPTPYTSRAESVGEVTVDSSTRTNAGVFNNSNQRQTVSARVYYSAGDPDQTLTFSLPPKGWAQKPVTAKGERGYILWRVPREAYLWVVSIDNGSNDGTLSFPTPVPR